MSWKEHHRASEVFAARAEQALRHDESDAARELYAHAAAAEERAASDLDRSKRRTLGISVVSAVALHYKSEDFCQAQSVAYHWLAAGLLPEFAVRQLRFLLETMWAEEGRDLTGVQFAARRLLVSAQGGEVLPGGARLDLIAATLKQVSTLLQRTAELLHGAPFRSRGQPNAYIKENVRPWILQTAPGSFQFAVALQQPDRVAHLPTRDSFQSNVVDRSVAILATALAGSDRGFRDDVPDPRYRGAILKLARDLSPSGMTDARLLLRSTDAASRDHEVILDSETHRAFDDAFRRHEAEGLEEEEELFQTQLVGRLRAVDLNKHWLELTRENGTVRVVDIADDAQDRVAGFVNEQVVVVAATDGSRNRFRGIERLAGR